MRRMAVALAVLAVLGLSTSVWAGQGGGRKRQRDPQVPPPAPTPLELKGALLKAEANEITVVVKLPVDAVTTSVMINGVGKAIAELRAGQAVTITLTAGRTTRIDVTEAESAKEPAKDVAKEAAKEAPKEPPKEPATPK